MFEALIEFNLYQPKCLSKDMSLPKRKEEFEKFFDSPVVRYELNMASFWELELLWVFLKFIATLSVTDNVLKNVFVILSFISSKYFLVLLIFLRSSAWVKSSTAATTFIFFKVNNVNFKTISELWSKLTIKTPEWHHLCRSGVVMVNFEHTSYIVLVFPL